ncbi:DUF4913 domain-containing protein [Motilibacter aurantiacus]|uniref:DUF4913 domain-containing protein n=1 Tax=Motilibacter aurantiacus TaxID=2714955 RepID=UPI00140E630B|nr:DUF4913 domain-containing protein [Motilibacter aurantiacus]NHC47157.1 DUF4913 domain-containing protein [Motilibacter aurantiacus]
MTAGPTADAEPPDEGAARDEPGTSLSEAFDRVPELADLREAAAWLFHIQNQVDDLDGLVNKALHGPGAAPMERPALPAQPPVEAGDEWETYYRDVEDFVNEFFVIAFARTLGGNALWCDRWWDHPEAVLRLEGLWRTFETSRRQPENGGPIFLGQVDHHLPVLLSASGPFAACGASGHNPPPPLPSRPAPPGHWAPMATGPAS